jgi:hypothetical protein
VPIILPVFEGSVVNISIFVGKYTLALQFSTRKLSLVT